jgi:hypothetical protein
MPTGIKLETACKENCSPTALLRLLEHDESEAINRLRHGTRIEDIRFTQGELHVIERYKDILKSYLNLK